MKKQTKQASLSPDDLFMPIYKRDGAPMICGRGMYLYDEDERAYLDFGAGIAVNTLGHANPIIRNAIQNQSDLLIHASNLYFSRAQIDLAEFLIKYSFADHVFFCNSGTEANEAAIKFARKWAKKRDEARYHILSFYDGFHGRTYGALSATAQKQFHTGFEPMVEGFHWAPLNDIDATKKILAQHKFAAIIVEPIQGEGGVIPTQISFLKFIKNWCNKNKAALIFDEIQTGIGRTGTLWNYEQCGITPDIMTLAKPLGGGLPLGATLCTTNIAKAISIGNHGTTFGGNPVACAAGLAVIQTVSKKSFLSNVIKNGNYCIKKLQVLKKDFPAIKEIRGSGLMIGVEMDSDPSDIVVACKQEGLLVVKAGNHTIRLLPPLTVTKIDIDNALEILSKVLRVRYGIS